MKTTSPGHNPPVIRALYQFQRRVSIATEKIQIDRNKKGGPGDH